jgi:hypothetical protein
VAGSGTAELFLATGVDADLCADLDWGLGTLFPAGLAALFLWAFACDLDLAWAFSLAASTMVSAGRTVVLSGAAENVVGFAKSVAANAEPAKASNPAKASGRNN